jgi:large subunit ribosomal protein L15
MKINNLAPARGARRNGKRVGRGIGSGLGKTSGKGSNGQKARSGGTKAVGFEGGQMPITQKMPKRGFNNIFRTRYEIVNLKDLARFESGSQVDPKALEEKGLVRKNAKIKILGNGDVSKQLKVRAHKFSGSATKKLIAAGGQAEVL